MRILAISLSLALASTSASAQAPQTAQRASATAAPSSSSIELARQFVGLTISSDEYADTMIEGASAMKAALVAEYDGDPHQQAVSLAMDEMIARTEAKVRTLVPLLYEAYAQAYAREFSDAELRQLISFAESPVGKHYLTGFETLQDDPAIAAAQEALWEEMDVIMEDIGKEFCTRKADLQIALGEEAECPYAEESVTRRG